jgi:hypothetical protein
MVAPTCDRGKLAQFIHGKELGKLFYCEVEIVL